jgi:hypothetical protein
MRHSATISSRLLWGSLVIAGLAVAGACSSPNSNSLVACQEGTQVLCPCAGGSTGTTTCSGGTYGECVCGASATMDSGGGQAPPSGGSGDSGGVLGSGSDAAATDAPASSDSAPEEGGAHDGSGGGEGGHHDGATEGGGTEGGGGEGGAVDFGKTCAGDGDCTAPYPTCQLIQGAMICTKACLSASDCPDPPTDGTCNAMGYCK